MICWPWPVVEFSVRGNARRIVPAVGPVSQIGGIAVSTSTPFYTDAIRPLSISRQKLPIHVAARILLHHHRRISLTSIALPSSTEEYTISGSAGFMLRYFAKA